MNVPYISFNNQFLIKEMRVYDDEICYPEKYSMEVSKLFKSRYNLHHDCYNHKTIHAYELMVVDILLECHGVLYDFTKDIYDAEKYLMLDDSIIDEIQYSEDPRLAKARVIIQRMQFRQHYLCVGEKGLNRVTAERVWKNITAEAICSFAEPDENGERLLPTEVGVKKYTINHGLKRDHPLNNVKFFDKKGHKKESYPLIQCKKESMLPKDNQAWTVRCFVKPKGEQKLQ